MERPLHAVALELIGDACVAVDRRMRVTYANRQASTLFGCPRAELLGNPLPDVFPEGQRELVAELCARSLREQASNDRIEYFPDWNRWMECRLHPLPDGLLVFLQDVTAGRRDELQRLRRERDLAKLVEHTPDPLLRLSADGLILFASIATERFTGRPVHAIVGHRLSDLGFPAALVRRWEHTLQRVVRTRAARQLAFAVPTPSGERQVEARLIPEPDHHGVASVLVILRDVTEQARTAARLQEREERFRALVEHASDMIAILDDDARYMYVSPSHERVLGWPDEALLESTPLAFIHPEDADMVRLAYAEVKRAPGETIHPLPLRFRHANGSWCTLDVLLTNLADDPAVRGVVVNSRDVTEQEVLANQLRQAQRMEALGQLAGGVAHDFNNVLAAVTGFTQLALDQLPAGTSTRADLEEVLRAAGRGAGVARQLLAFGRPVSSDVSAAVDLGAVVREVADLLRPLLPASITIDLRLPAEPVWVRGVRPQLDQVLMNLAVNARDAMPGGGTLAISLDRSGGDGHRQMSRLQVRDTGCGMSTEVLSRLFEPFFTTKPTGSGTGLGLAVVYGIVRHAGGRVVVDSKPGAGSTFTILLPPARPEADAARAASRSPARPVAGATVLLAEDEEGVRLSAGRLLQQAGFRVLLASDGADAWRLLVDHDGAVDLVLTDATMPALSGRSLATRVAERWPSLPVVLMSGYEAGEAAAAAESGADADPEDAGQPGNARIVAYLDKPFTADRLLDVVRRAVDG